MKTLAKLRSLVIVTVLVLTMAAVIQPVNVRADTPDPYGFADSCALVAGKTVIYGWAHDTDAPSGSTPNVNVTITGTGTVTAPTDQAGYRDTQINAYIAYNHPTHTVSNTYGFIASFSGLYKGSELGISGTVINVGAGASIPLGINFYGYSDNNTSKPYFANSKIPQACLADMPVTPTPSPTPTPTPTPKPSPKPSPTPSPTPSPSPAPTPTIPLIDVAGVNPNVTAFADSVQIVVPGQGAKSIRLVYGSAADKLTETASDQAGQTNNTLIAQKLAPGTTYYYQVVYLNAEGKETRTPVATFTTKGSKVTLSFVDKDGRGLPKVKVLITGVATEAIADDSGNLVINGAKAGELVFTYSYQGSKPIERKITVGSKAEQSTTITIADVTAPNSTPIDTEAATSKKSGISFFTVILILVLLGLVGYGIFWFIKRRRSSSSAPLMDYTSVPDHNPRTPAQLPIHHQAPAQAPQTSHMGQSLRDLVIESMNNQNQPPTPKA